MQNHQPSVLLQKHQRSSNTSVTKGQGQSLLVELFSIGFGGIVFANFCGRDHPVSNFRSWTSSDPPKETHFFNMTELIPIERYKTSHPNSSPVVNSFLHDGCPLQNLNTFLSCRFYLEFPVSITSLEFVPQLILRSKILCHGQLLLHDICKVFFWVNHKEIQLLQNPVPPGFDKNQVLPRGRD